MIRTYVTPELGVAIGRIATAFPERGIGIHYQDGDPENLWHVTAERAPGGDLRFAVNDETGEIAPPLPVAPTDALAPRNDIAGIVAYNWADEEHDYDECLSPDNDNDAGGHIFLALRRVHEWLTSTVPVVYVVQPADPSESAAVFIRKEDADAFAATFDHVGIVERVTVCDAKLAAELVASRTDDPPQSMDITDRSHVTFDGDDTQ